MWSFWISGFVYKISWKCHLPKKSSIADDRLRKVFTLHTLTFSIFSLYTLTLFLLSIHLILEFTLHILKPCISSSYTQTLYLLSTHQGFVINRASASSFQLKKIFKACIKVGGAQKCRSRANTKFQLLCLLVLRLSDWESRHEYSSDSSMEKK